MGIGQALPYIEGITGLLGIFHQDQLEKEAEKKEQAKFDRLLSQLANQLRPTVRQELAGLGQVAREDIGKTFDEARSRARSSAISSGLTGTTVLPGITAGIERQRSRAQRQLEENLSRERLGYEMDITGTELGIIGSQQFDPGMSPLFAISQLANRFIPRETPEAPGTDYGAIALGAGIPALGTVLGGPIGGAVGAGFGSLFAGGGGAPAPAYYGAPPPQAYGKPRMCIAGDTMLATPDGMVPFSDIKVGDLVLTSRDSYAEVVFKDYGVPREEHALDFVKLTTNKGKSITISQEHVIHGKRLEEWRIGDHIDHDNVITEMQAVRWVAAGDLVLDDVNEYWANGFWVKSMLKDVYDDGTTETTNSADPENGGNGCGDNPVSPVPATSKSA